MRLKKVLKLISIGGAVAGASLLVLAKSKKHDSIFSDYPEQRNPFEGKKVIFVKDETKDVNADGERGYLEAIKEATPRDNIYARYIKRGIDEFLSLAGMLILGPMMGIIALAIKVEDPGPVLFTQKRIGQNKQFFKLHKFRSMKMSTPQDVPTHMLDNPDQYITKVGRFIREHSLDELPQIWDIFIGNMSVVGPRPALWNQDVLVAERDKYGANDVKPGLTGWAQINGRDELELSEKARYDGEYVSQISTGVGRALLFDAKCFFETFTSVAKSDGVVEGGTGTMHDMLREGVPIDDPTPVYGCDIDVSIDKSVKKKVLITGANSYIGESVKEYAEKNYPNIVVETIDMEDPSWRKHNFFCYDCVYHVAGIAHADTGKVSDEIKEKYYSVNTDLAIETAKKAKEEGVNHFILMSSIIVYGDSAPYGKDKVITKNTAPTPSNFYGDSKWQADKGVRSLEDENFKVAVLRPPMIYGKDSRGNYQILAKIAKNTPVFPRVDNQRSMLFVGNLCEFICKLILSGTRGIYFPQNAEYVNTGEMVRAISEVKGRATLLTSVITPAVKIATFVPGKIRALVDKSFGSCIYEKSLSKYGFEYQKYDFNKSIEMTEGAKVNSNINGKHILLISQYFYPETFRVNDMALEWVKRGYKVTVLTGIPNYPMGKFFEGYDYIHRRSESWEGVDIIRIPLIPRGNSSSKLMNAAGMTANYLSFIASGKEWVRKNNIGADIVFTVEVSPMTQALIGIWYGKKYNVPTYLYVQDLWPENVEIITGIHSKAVIGPIDKMVDKIYKETDYIFTTSPSFVEAIVNRTVPVDRGKVKFWPQYAEEFYEPLNCEIPEIDKDDDAFIIAFTGNIGIAQGLDILPRAASLLKDDSVKFVIVGDGRYQNEFEEMIKEYDVEEKFVMIPRQPANRIPKILGACDAGFISFNKTPLWEMTIPAKLQSYMACGKAIIASASGETRRIIEEADCGICCEIGDADALTGAIRQIMSEDITTLGNNARSYFEQHFDKKTLMDEMDTYIES